MSLIELDDFEWNALLDRNIFPYIQTLTGSPNPSSTNLHWQTFDDAHRPGEPGHQKYLTSSFYGSYEEFSPRLKELNRRGAGIFITVNESDGTGRKIENITRIRAVWAEFDGVQVDHQNLVLPPSMVVQSCHGAHIYWVLKGAVTKEQCREAVKALAFRLSGDPKVHDPSRVLRAPGFFHLKDPEHPFLVEFVQSSPETYTIQEILRAYPPAPPKAKEERKRSTRGVPAPDQEPPTDLLLEERIAQARAYTSRIPGAAQGDRHNAMFSLAAALTVGFDLPDKEALPILLAFAGRCRPSVPAVECPKLLEDGRRYGQETRGSRLRPAIPGIEITTREKDLADEVVLLLAKQGGTYHRGHRLVHVVTEHRPSALMPIPAGTPSIVPIHEKNLRERISAAVRFLMRLPGKGPGGDDAFVPVHPPSWLAPALHTRAAWPELPYLKGVYTSPILRPDGTVLDQPGYDPSTGVLFQPGRDFPPIPTNPTEADARFALEALEEVFADFPFALPVHRVTAVAAILTPFARVAMDAPAPLFLYDANVRGSGKTLIADVTGVVVTGRTLARMAQAPNEEEEEKRLAGIAMEGDTLVLIDNITRPLGSPALDAILTGTRWKPRILGKTGNPEFEVHTTFLATANNAQLQGDICRRMLHIRLCSKTDHPEDRDGFLHDPLIPWVIEHHPRLAAAALTILRAYRAAGRPRKDIRSWGSYEAWSQWVREPLVWLTGLDPVDTREELEQHADIEAIALAALMLGWERLLGLDKPYTVRELLDARGFYSDDLQSLRDALCTFCPPKPGLPVPDARQIGNKFKSLRDRPQGDRVFIAGDCSGKGQTWILRKIGRQDTESPGQFSSMG